MIVKALFSIALIWMVGCSTPGKFTSQRDESYNDKLQRTLIVYHDVNTRATLGRHFSRRLVDRLGDLLGRQNVRCESVRLSDSASDSSEPAKGAAERFQPTQVLYFTIIRANTISTTYWVDPNELPQFNHSTVVTLYFEVQDSKMKNFIWKTSADYYYVPRPEDVAKQVVEQLHTAKLL